MPEDPETHDLGQDNKEGKDDLETYLEEMKSLESDFSDLDDLDFEEIKAMQEAIEKVREGDIPNAKEVAKPIQVDTPEVKLADQKRYDTEKEKLLTDFSDLDEIDFDELEEMKEAVESVKQEEFGLEIDSTPKEALISSELEERIKQELQERKEEEEEEAVTPEKFIEYASTKRDKIWYHALYYLTFQAEDNIASKQLLYDMLKEETSKSPIDPLPEHQFYFGLGYILRLTINNKQIVRYLSGNKFKVNIGIKILEDILEKIGEPISTKPIIKEEEKRKMFKDFLADDFLDI